MSIEDPLIGFTQNEIADLRLFADNEIGAGRYLSGARLHHLLDQIAVAGRAEDLDDEKTNMQDEIEVLGDELAETRVLVIALDTSLAETLTALGELPGAESSLGKTIKDARNRGALEAADAFREALEEIRKKLDDITVRLGEHIDATDFKTKPVEQKVVELRTP